MRVALTIFLTVAAAAPAFAQQAEPTHPMTAAEVLKQAQSTSTDLEQLRAALKSPDQTTRVTTMTAMIQSGNPSLMSLAISEGGGSSDEVMRTLAVRAAFREITTVALQPVNTLQDKALEYYTYFSGGSGGVRIFIKSYDWTTGRYQEKNDLVGAVSGNRIDFVSPACTGTLKSAPGSWVFEGRVKCSYTAANLDEVMRLQIR